MFLVFGISNGEKRLNFIQSMLCSHCGQFGRFEIYMTYMYFSLFFIPIFRWNRKYYVKSTCCQSVYEIDKELGKRINQGEKVTLTEEDLNSVNKGPEQTKQSSCPSCGYQIDPQFNYCPKCGTKLL